jgi:hypothetical protein
VITLQDYFMGREATYGSELTPEHRANAARVLEAVIALLSEFGEVRKVTSGWRPAAVNARTRNAAPKSKHMTCQAIDLADPEGDLDEWCYENLGERLVKYGLYLEHPAATKSWCHLQIVPPRSGKRVFYP